MSELKKRILVAIIGIPLTIAVVFLGGVVFFLVVLLLANLTLWEFYQLAEKKGISPSIFTGLFFSTLIQTLFYLLIQNELSLNKFDIFLVLILVVCLLPSMYLFVQVWNRNSATTLRVSFTVFGALWISFVFSTLLAIRFLPLFESTLINFVESRSLPKVFLLQNPLDDNWAAKFFIVILGTIWLCDSFAYFFGVAFGRHKLAPRTSPNKTWEGAIAGYIGSVLSFSLLNWIFRLNLPGAYQILFATIIGVVGQIGDLAESKIKREFNVKDSSAILPGHGGFLDRLDSIMFVFPAILLVVILLLKF